jgi:hypothetical protein
MVLNTSTLNKYIVEILRLIIICLYIVGRDYRYEKLIMGIIINIFMADGLMIKFNLVSKKFITINTKYLIIQANLEI